MKIAVTGATGFIGRHVLDALSGRGHDIVAAARHVPSAPLPDDVRFVPFDMMAGEDPVAVFGRPDLLIHLAWPGLPNYKSLFHFEDNLPASYRLIKAVVGNGTGRVLVTGTCFEYGMQQGCLSEDGTPAAPANPYALAKDALRGFLHCLAQVQPFTLQWLRLFYMYGEGQNPKSLLAQLDTAIERGDATFDMSGGEQIRDYLSVGEVARRIRAVAEDPACTGIVNCCSGRPVTVRQLVADRIAERGSPIKMNLGRYPYPDYEPMEFWGDAHKIDGILNGRHG